MHHRSVGQHRHDPRGRPGHLQPVGGGGSAQSGGVRDGRHVQQQVGGAAEGSVHHHRVVDGVVAEHVGGGLTPADRRGQRPDGAQPALQPDRLTRRGQGGVADGQPEGLTHHLGGGRGAQELAAATRGGAGGTTQRRRLVQGDQPVGVAGPEGLDGAGVLAPGRRQRHPARHEHRRDVRRSGQRHHHGRQSLVAGGDADHADPVRQRPDQPGASRWPRRCGTAASRTWQWCPATARRTGRETKPAKGRKPRPVSSPATVAAMVPSS